MRIYAPFLQRRCHTVHSLPRNIFANKSYRCPRAFDTRNAPLLIRLVASACSYAPSYINYAKKQVASRQPPNRTKRTQTGDRCELSGPPGTIGIDSRRAFIRSIYLRSSTPINTWTRSRGSGVLHSSRDRLVRTPTPKIVIHHGNCGEFCCLEPACNAH